MSTANLQHPASRARDAIGKTYFREVRLSGADVSKETRILDLAFASTAGVDRAFGTEILDVSARAMRLERLNDGGPLLLDHDPRDVIGVVEKARIGSDGVARARVRFGRSDRAEEAFQDVLDGIRTKVSVGYIIHDIEEAGRSASGQPTYRVTDWEPLEVSLVAIPADVSVGVGRSLKGKKRMSTEDLEDDLEQPRLTRAQRRQQRQEQSSDEDRSLITYGRVMKMGRHYEHMHAGATDLAARVADSGGDEDDFKARLLVAMRAARVPVTDTGSPSPDDYVQSGRSPYGEAARVSERYGPLKGFKGEGAEARAYTAGMWLKAQAGDAHARRWVGERTWTSSPGSGDNLVPTELANEVIRNVEEMGAFRANARVWPMNSGSTEVPLRLSGVTAGVVGEDVPIIPGDPSTTNITLTAKEIGASIKVSRTLMEDSAIALADYATVELGLAMATVEDSAGFIGDGTSTYAGIRGIKTMLDNASFAGGRVTAGAGRDTFGEVTVEELVGLMGLLPEWAKRGAKWYCSGTCRDLVFTRIAAAAGGNSTETLTGGVGPSFLGYPIVVTPVLPSNPAGDYTNSTMLLFGDLTRSSLFGLRRGFDLEVDPSRYREYRQVLIQATERFDIVNHSMGDNDSPGAVVGLYGGT